MDVSDEVVRERIFPGVNMSPNISAMNGSWSMALRPNLDDSLEHEIMERLESSIPRELFPVADESGRVDVNMVLRANHDLPWLDDLRRYTSEGCANGAEDNRQPVRRTASVVLGKEYDVEDPINTREEKRKVLDMHVYTCREMPPDAWMSRPMTNLEYAAMMIIWTKCWPYLPRHSRISPPNALQYCIYQRVLKKQMGKHRDNFCRRDLKLLAENRDAKLPENGTWAGVRNSQVKGSAVIVYSMGNSPMYMVFSRLSAGGRAYQEKDEYVVEPTFCFRFEKGWICILDCIDDLLMMHSLTFEGIKESGNPDECVRVALVIRLLDTVGQFYCDTATMRLTGQSLKYAGKDKMPSGVARNTHNRCLL
jgi:mRNA-degrading endonuclease YafQ of YafQ-DinJ toxin-antitoxin module